MKMTDLRAKARAIFGPAIAEPMPKQPNGAKALQQRANARPIPTYKVGGVVKKPMPSPGESVKSGNRMSKQEGDEMRFMDMMEKKKRPMPTPAESVKSGNRMAREEGAEMKKMKMAVGGKVPAPNMMSVAPSPGKGSPAMSAAQMYKLKAQELAMKRASARPMPQPEAAPMPERPQPEAAPTSPKLGGIGAGTSPRLGGIGAGLPVLGRSTDGSTEEFQAPIKRARGGKVQTSSDTARKLATEMGGMKKGGKVKDVEVDMKGLGEMSRSMSSLPKADLESRASEARNLNAVRAKETSDATKKQSFKEAFAEARRDQGPNGVFTWRGNTYNTKMAGESSKGAPARAAAPASTRAAPPAAAPASRLAAPAAGAPASRPAAKPPAASANKSGNANSSMSSVIRNLDSGYDLDAEAKKIMAKRNDSFFRAPISMKEAREEARAEAENVRKMSGYRAEQERKKKSLDAGRKANPDLVSQFVDMTMNPGYKKGGKVKEPKPKNGLAVMIAIGKPMKPAKKMDGGPMGYMDGGEPMGYAAGGAGKMRKGQAPIKKAQGGAAKVRKGMMSPEGNIINAMNKMRGK